MSNSRLWKGLGCGVLGLAALGAFAVGWAVLRLEPALRSEIIAQADRRGIVLDFGEIELGFGWMKLHDVRFALRGVSSFSGRASRFDVVLSGLHPDRVSIEQAHIDVTGSAPLVLLEAGSWVRDHAATLKEPFDAHDMTLDWREAPGGERWLSMSGVGIAPLAAGGAALTARGAKVEGVEIGAVGAAWTADDTVATLGFGQADLTKAPLEVVVAHASTTPQVTVTLRPTKLSRLGAPLGVKLPLEAVAHGSLAFALPRTTTSAPVAGKASITLDGWIPPHPRELDGLVFGAGTRFDTALVLSADRKRVDLADSKLVAGAFKLAGGGSVTRDADHARVRMDLRGNLACSDVAKSAVMSHVDGPVGAMVGELAKFALQGSVSVRVQIDGDSRSLAAASVRPSVGVGCGIKPLIPGLPGIDLGDLPKLPAIDLPKLPGIDFPSPQ